MDAKERDQEVEILQKRYGVSALLTDSLCANPKEARDCIRFFKQMMCLVNGTAFASGLGLVWFGITHHTYVRYFTIFVGILLALKFATVFRQQLMATKVMERFLRKQSSF